MVQRWSYERFSSFSVSKINFYDALRWLRCSNRSYKNVPIDGINLDIRHENGKFAPLLPSCAQTETQSWLEELEDAFGTSGVPFAAARDQTEDIKTADRKSGGKGFVITGS